MSYYSEGVGVIFIVAECMSMAASPINMNTQHTLQD